MAAINKTAPLPAVTSFIRTVANRSSPVILHLFRYCRGNNSEQQVSRFAERDAMKGLGLEK